MNNEYIKIKTAEGDTHNIGPIVDNKYYYEGNRRCGTFTDQSGRILEMYRDTWKLLDNEGSKIDGGSRKNTTITSWWTDRKNVCKEWSKTSR